MKNKEEYIQQAKLKLDQLDSRIDLLEAEALKRKADVTAACHSKLADLKSKRDQLTKKFETMKDSSGDALESLKEGFDKVMEDVRTTYENVKEAVTHK